MNSQDPHSGFKMFLTVLAIIYLLIFCAVMSGCAALEPDVSVDTVHVSHVTQHFGPDPTSYGYNAAELALHWHVKRFELTVADGLVLDRCHHATDLSHPECGALVGPREVFEARASYYLWQHR